MHRSRKQISPSQHTKLPPNSAAFYRLLSGSYRLSGRLYRQARGFGIQCRQVIGLDWAMQQQDGSGVPDAMLLLAPSCPHCPLVLESLAQMVKSGQIGGLEVVNIVVHPERAQQLGVRSVPWFRIGPLQFEGVHSKQELQLWAAKAMSQAGQQDYIEQLLATGALPRALEFIRQEPQRAQRLIGLLEKPDANINVRVGIGAVMEHLAEDGGLTPLLSELGRLSQSSDARLRSDACYYLSLSGAKSALPYIEALIEDKDKEVQEIAREARETLLQALQHS